MRLFSIFIFSFLALPSIALQLKGVVLKDDMKPLPYANVFVFKGDVQLANALADSAGRFIILLDSGKYRVQANYHGYHSQSKQIMLYEDADLAFVLQRSIPDPVADIKEVPTDSEVYYYLADHDDMVRPEGRVLYEKSASGMAFMGVRTAGVVNCSPYPNGSAGKLTAGEINDFSKWEYWQDLGEGELAEFKEVWEMDVKGRYSVQVKNKEGLPIPDLTVKLMVDKTILYQARTDNTGKAELWASLEGISNTGKLRIVLEYHGRSAEIKSPVYAGNGDNLFTIDHTCEASNNVDIAFVVDATGSMNDELSFLKAELSNVMLKATQFDQGVNFRFANVFYRDFGDAYLTRTQDFSSTFSAASAFVNEQAAGGGGDFEEAVDVALDTAINTLSWSKDARARILFLVLDAPPHQDSSIKRKLLLLTADAAKKGIRIVPMVASGLNKSAEYLLRSMSLATNGSYLFLTDDSGIGNEHLKPSTEDYQVELLSTLLQKVIIRFTYMPDCQQKVPELPWQIDEDSITASIPKDSSDLDGGDSLDQQMEVRWTYFPNPTQGVVYITASEHITELHVTDLNGKLLQRITDIHPEAQVKVDLSSYASGIYLIRFPVGKTWVSGKIILTH